MRSMETMPEDAKLAEVDQQLEDEVKKVEEKVAEINNRMNRAALFGS